jgi:hypothetical protein
MIDEAFAACVESQRLRKRSQEQLAALQKAFEEGGLSGVRKQTRPKEWHNALEAAAYYAKLARKDEAFKWLEEAWSEPLWGYEDAPSAYIWDPLRDDPRFEHLLRKLNLPEEAIERQLAMPKASFFEPLQ